jgi:hypothetical protein
MESATCRNQTSSPERWMQKGRSDLEVRMITSEQCKAYLDECRELGRAPDVSPRRATAIMAICRAWVMLSREVARYDIVLKDEN